MRRFEKQVAPTELFVGETGLLQTGRAYGASPFGSEGRFDIALSKMSNIYDTMNTSKECPICHGEVQPSPRTSDYAVFSYDCKTCGCYDITLEAIEDRVNGYDSAYRSKLSSFIKEKTLFNPRGVVCLQRGGEPTEGLQGSIYTLDEALNAFPRTLSERIDRALLNFDRMTTQLNSRIGFSYEISYPIIFAADAEEAEYLIDLLVRLSFIEMPDYKSMGRPFRLTARGWQRIDELQRGSFEKPRQGFVAMWFDDSMQEARKEGFIAGIEKAGYEPLVIADRDDFNEDIHDQIIAEIRKSRFVIADFTGHRPNVYYEAGFAEALGKPVIYTCRKDQIEDAHFDIRQRNHIVWENERIDQLCDRLGNRIEATIGLPAS